MEALAGGDCPGPLLAAFPGLLIRFPRVCEEVLEGCAILAPRLPDRLGELRIRGQGGLLRIHPQMARPSIADVHGDPGELMLTISMMNSVPASRPHKTVIAVEVEPLVRLGRPAATEPELLDL